MIINLYTVKSDGPLYLDYLRTEFKLDGTRLCRDGSDPVSWTSRRTVPHACATCYNSYAIANKYLDIITLE
jgi:hypothetical protein